MTYTRKDYCENTSESSVFGKCKQTTYHTSELQVDHKDGNPKNNDETNLWTIC